MLHSEIVLRKKKSCSLGSLLTPLGRVEGLGLPLLDIFLPCENPGLVGMDCVRFRFTISKVPQCIASEMALE